MKKLICGLLAAACAATPVYAAELSAKYNAASGMYEISGIAPEASQNGLVGVTVVSDADLKLGWATTLRTDGTGAFSDSFTFAPDAKGGYYTVSVGVYKSGIVKTASLFYVTEGEKAAALDAINAAETTEALDKAIRDNAPVLGINIGMYDSVGGAKRDLLNTLIKNEKYKDVDSFTVALETATACALIKNADADNITGIMDEYFTYLGLDKSEICSEFLTLDKNEVYKKMAGASCLNAKDVLGVFESSVALSLINKTEKWNDFKTVLDKYIGYTGIDTAYYDKCDKDDLASALCDKDYSTPQELYSAIKVYYDGIDVSGDSGNNSSSGGGGGGSNRGFGGLTTFGSGSKTDEPTEEVPLYNDMTGFEWAETAIKALSDRGIVGGDGSGGFKPEASIAREEFVKMLLLAFGLFKDGAEADFADVDKNDWAYPYVACAFESGLVKGMDNNNFGYGMKITREDMAVLIKRAAECAGAELSEVGGTELNDLKDVSEYAKDSVVKMADAGIINGYSDGTFRPQNNASRAEAAVMIHRLISR